MSRSTSQSINDSTTTAIQFDTTTIDELSAWSSGANTKLTAPVTGWYILGGHVKYHDGTSGKRVLDPRINGTIFPGGISQPCTAALQGPDLVVTTVYHLTAGDYLEMTTWQNNGSAINVDAAQAWMLLL